MKSWTAVAIFTLFLFNAPIDMVNAQTSASSSCPSNAMPVALTLSTEVNQLNLPHLDVTSSDQQIASEVNMLGPSVNRTLQIKMPMLNGSSLKGLSVLVTPFDDLLNASNAVNPSDLSSACHSLAATFTLAADVTVLVAGSLPVQALLNIFNVASQYCNTGCTVSMANSIGNFISGLGAPALQLTWNLWSIANCKVIGNCASTTSSSTPEFPYQSLAPVAFVLLAAACYLVSRRDRRH